MNPRHEPVMVAEVLEHLAPSRGGVFVDCTVGLGGHARALLEAGASRLIGLDRDPAALAEARSALGEFGDRVELVHADYRRLNDVLDARGVTTVDGVLADLGVSSMQLDSPGRGFSFRQDDPLDMRMDTTTGPTAAESIRDVDEKTLADVIYEFGEERQSRRIARAIVAARARAPIETTGQARRRRQAGDSPQGVLADRSGDADVPGDPHLGQRRARRARRVRGDAARRLAGDGRLVVIAFHSLEDRIVKHTLRALQESGIGLRIRTKRPMVPGDAEVERNPRARSAKLRAAEQTGRGSS